MRELVPAPDPATAAARLGALPHRAWLDSAGGPARLARYAFLAADPYDLITPSHADPLGALRRAVMATRTPADPDLPPFQGGAIGYLAYEFGRRLEHVPPPRADDRPVPDIWFGVYDWVIAWDRERGRAWLVSTGLPATGAARTRRAAERATQVMALLGTEHTAHRTLHQRHSRQSAANGRPPTHPVPELGPAIRSVFTPDAYRAAVRRVRDYILAGDVFQVNLAQRLEAPVPDDPFTWYLRLRRVNAAPFGAYLDCGGFVVASASPERFVRMMPDGAVETRPIKGTRPRDTDPARDAALGAELGASAKDRAENVMIVDLLRNDLSRVCAPGTVHVPELCVLERYATVQHLVSTVTGRLAAGRDALDLLAAAFPGGSITGAPKVRAMAIVAALEPVARGVYCGAIGYLSVTGAMDTSIAIRTAVLRDGTATFGAGGGITADSDPDGEYAETLDKARGLAAAL